MVEASKIHSNNPDAERLAQALLSSPVLFTGDGAGALIGLYSTNGYDLEIITDKPRTIARIISPRGEQAHAQVSLFYKDKWDQEVGVAIVTRKAAEKMVAGETFSLPSADTEATQLTMFFREIG